MLGDGYMRFCFLALFIFNIFDSSIFLNDVFFGEQTANIKDERVLEENVNAIFKFSRWLEEHPLP